MMPLWKIKKNLSHINAIVAQLHMHRTRLPKDVKGLTELVDCLVHELPTLLDIEGDLEALRTCFEQEPEPDYDD